MANTAFEAYRKHQLTYTAGLKPFSEPFKAAQKKASAEWKAMKERGGPGPEVRENPSKAGGLIRTFAVLAVVAGVAIVAGRAAPPAPCGC